MKLANYLGKDYNALMEEKVLVDINEANLEEFVMVRLTIDTNNKIVNIQALRNSKSEELRSFYDRNCNALLRDPLFKFKRVVFLRKPTKLTTSKAYTVEYDIDGVKTCRFRTEKRAIKFGYEVAMITGKAPTITDPDGKKVHFEFKKNTK